jgi:hypothetical protein
MSGGVCLTFLVITPLQGVWEENQTGADQPVPCTAKLRISPGSHWTTTSNGRQHTSQSVVNRWLGMLVSMARSKLWPQHGHWMVSVTSILGRWLEYSSERA